MSARIEKIKAEFAKLPLAEQRSLLNELNAMLTNANNSIVKLAQLVQKEFGANLETEIQVGGTAREPVIYCTLRLPNGMEYKASGKNQKIAKQEAADKALADFTKTMRNTIQGQGYQR
jgi:dsRNA-specific ribonuclease